MTHIGSNWFNKRGFPYKSNNTKGRITWLKKVNPNTLIIFNKTLDQHSLWLTYEKVLATQSFWLELKLHSKKLIQQFTNSNA